MANDSTEERGVATSDGHAHGGNGNIASAGRTKASCDGITGFPMPLTPLRMSARRDPRPRFPYPVPNGWFAVAHSSELAPGKTKALYYFERDLVLFRTASGEARLMDAFCAHLGAHLAAGGRVEGDCIRCPFHGWLWNSESGSCIEIPYQKDAPIPKNAHMRTYPTIERNRLIWAWYHAHGDPPSFEIPDVPELSDADTHLPVDFHCSDIATCCQEVIENAPDFKHDAPVHGEEALPDAVDAYVYTTEGPYAHTKHGPFLTRQVGLGFNVGRCRMPGDEIPVMTMVTALTPIDREHVTLRALFTGPRARANEAHYVRDSVLGVFNQDIPIWENKILRTRPLLLKVERPIAEFRRWCLQFYSDFQPDD